MEITENKKESILEAFNKFLEASKDPKEFNRRVNLIRKSENDNNFLDYTCVLLVLSEFYDLLPKDENLEEIVYEYMVQLRSGLEENLSAIPPSLFGGLSEVGYSVYAIYKKTGYYKKFLNTLNNYIADVAMNLLDNAEDNIGNMGSVNYDTISGLAGYGGYLLMFKENDKILEVLKKIIKLVIKMSKDIEVKGYKVPGWYIPAENLPLESDKRDYSNGSFNLALSHGICGPLVFMALALNEGIEIEGQREAMEKIIKEVLRFHSEDEFGHSYWVGRVKFEDYIKGEKDIIGSDRQSWCYGPIGIARSLYIAGVSLKDEKLISFANKVLENIAESDPKSWELSCPHICHGYGGVLAIMEAMYKDTRNSKYSKCMEKVMDIIIDSFDPKSLFGFYNYTTEYTERYLEKEHPEFKDIDDHSFLEGSAGTVLTLMNCLYPERHSWMRHLLID